MTAEKHIKLGKYLALFSFLLGTLILVIYFFTSSFWIAYIGCSFIIFVGLINLGVFSAILFKAFNEQENKRKFFKTCGLMLLNIPIVLFYFWIVTILLNTMRVTFVNSTPISLTDLNVVGCQKKHIDKLEAGESKTIWINIPNDCSIDINYLSDGQRKNENVSGYVTNLGGQKIKHNIGGK
jgi:cellulose synthase/poly-beta-1,6-N-acetylglucosamine synthase-like glycosyltransferase